MEVDYAQAPATASDRHPFASRHSRQMQRILLTGKTGQVGWELQSTLAPLGELIAPGRSEMDLADPDSIRAAIRQARPEIIVNAAAFSSVDEVEAQPELAMRVNGVAPGILAEEAKRIGALLVHYSSAYVFDGRNTRPYVEEDTPNPINVYGRTKLAGEQAIIACGGAYLILRMSWVYSLRGVNFLTTFLRLARENKELPVVDDQIGSPTWARSIAAATGHLLGKQDIRGESGIYNLAADGYISRLNFAQHIIALAQKLPSAGRWAELRPVTTAEYPLPAARPLYCAMNKEKIKRIFGIEMPDWESQLRPCMDEWCQRLP